MQIRYITDKKSHDLFRESVNRVKSMALIHENLYQSDNLDNVDFNKYVNRLISQLFNVHGTNIDRIKVIQDIEVSSFTINVSIPLGLILNEILNNSLKYAFPDNRSGYIKLDYKETDGICTFIIEDNGIGIDKDIDLENTNTLGIHLIRSLSSQIKGTLETDYTNGTKYKLTFKKG